MESKVPEEWQWLKKAIAPYLMAEEERERMQTALGMSKEDIENMGRGVMYLIGQHIEEQARKPETED